MENKIRKGLLLYVHEFKNGRKTLEVVHTTLPPDYVLLRLGEKPKKIHTYLDLHNWVEQW